MEDVEPKKSAEKPKKKAVRTTRKRKTKRKAPAKKSDADAVEATSDVAVEAAPSAPAGEAPPTSETVGTPPPAEGDQAAPSELAKPPVRKRRSRGGRKRKTTPSTNVAEETPAPPIEEPPREDRSVERPVEPEEPVAEKPAVTEPVGAEPSPVEKPAPRNGRRKRRRRSKRTETAVVERMPEDEAQLPQPEVAGEPSPPSETPEAAPKPEADEPAERSRRSRSRRGRRSSRSRRAASASEAAAEPLQEDSSADLMEDEPFDEEEAGAIGVAPADASTGRAQREMIINVSAGEECRVAILHQGRLEELHIERQSSESHVGNIYKGRVTNVEPSIQAAFVDFGLAKNGFLHISDVQPRYFPDGKGEPEQVGKKVPRRDRPPIHKCFRRGQEVIVQITKEGVGTKGPTLTTYLSIPGRYLVMMPGMNRLGVSRKIEDEDIRRQMRSVLNELTLPGDMGFILRTAGLDRTKRDLQRDLNYLRRLWKIVEERIRKTRAPSELYQESDLVIRTIRDLSTSDFDRIVIDHEPTAHKAQEFMRIAMPRARNVIELDKGPEPIFHKYGIEDEIEKINARHVPLKSGGSIVIESTEAMVTIDVNSGKFRQLDDAEETAFQINLEAAEEIARQLRLRDLGGLVVCDFIDLLSDRHKRAVERTLRDALKAHKERARILRMSQFGLIEMTRQRQRASIKRSIYSDCPHCKGTGVTKTLETMVLEGIRILQLAAHQNDVRTVTLSLAPEVAATMLNQRRAVIHRLEVDTKTTITIVADPTHGIDQLTKECRDNRGRVIGADHG